VSQVEKHRLEYGAVRRIVSRLPDGQLYLELWEEFEAGLSPEARFVRQLDRLEMGLQAAVYQLQDHLDGDEFFASARQALVDPQLAALLDEVQTLAGKQAAGESDGE
jgi:putative hydrolase of HD superfamily